MECKKEQNKVNCNCSHAGCPRHGICCDCVAAHRKKGQLPACYFPDDAERTHDRSIEHFIAIVNERGAWWK